MAPIGQLRAIAHPGYRRELHVQVTIARPEHAAGDDGRITRGMLRYCDHVTGLVRFGGRG